MFVGVHQISDVTTYALVAILLVGPFIAWPRRRNTLTGWHTAMGWFLMPLVALGPVTAVMMMLHIGSGARGGGPPKGEGGPRGRGGQESGAPVADFIETAHQKGVDLHGLRAAARQGQGVLLTVASTQGLRYHAVSKAGAVGEAKPAPSAIRQLHEGTWAGAVSGSVSLLSAVGLAAMLVTGAWSWLRKALRKNKKKRV